MEKKLIAPHVTFRGNHRNLRKSVYLAMMFLTFHVYFVVYINSNFLRQFAPAYFINVLYILGACLNLFLFFTIPAIIRRYGSFKVMAGLILVEMVALIGLASSQSLVTVTAFFIVHQAMPPLLYFGLDLFLERCSKRKSMGKTRGTYLTLANCIVVISPTIVGYILYATNFQTIYLISFLFLVPLFFLTAAEFKHVDEPTKTELHHHIPFHTLFKRREVGIVFITTFLLQFFYAIMTIYMPLYLYQTIGLNWQQIGIVFTIMLIPFVIFELPLGALADKKIGEKEILMSGFLIAAIATSLIPYMATNYFLAWAALLFVTRIGASFIEIANETYFFKRVLPHDTNLISLYRSSMPLSYIIAPLCASVLLLTFPVSSVFIMLGVVLLIGAVAATRLHDTL